jgi:hypothetical protein
VLVQLNICFLIVQYFTHPLRERWKIKGFLDEAITAAVQDLLWKNKGGNLYS